MAEMVVIVLVDVCRSCPTLSTTFACDVCSFCAEETNLSFEPFCSIEPKIIWAAPCENMFSGIYGQRRPRSLAQSDQDIHCPLTESLNTTKCMN